MEVMEEMVGVKRESVTCLVVRLELERSISVFTSFLEVSTINMAVEVEREKEKRFGFLERTPGRSEGVC